MMHWMHQINPLWYINILQALHEPLMTGSGRRCHVAQNIRTGQYGYRDTEWMLLNAAIFQLHHDSPWPVESEPDKPVIQGHDDKHLGQSLTIQSYTITSSTCKTYRFNKYSETQKHGVWCWQTKIMLGKYPAADPGNEGVELVIVSCTVLHDPTHNIFLSV